MVALGSISMSDISRQKRYEAQIGVDGLTDEHTVGQAVEHYLSRVGIRDNSLRWTAFSRGLKLDNKKSLGEVAELEREWTVMPEVSAGSC